MSRRPTRAALHRLISIDTCISMARTELSIGTKVDPRALADLGITDLPEIIARLEAHLKTIRAHARSMFDEQYPQQPGSPGTNT